MAQLLSDQEIRSVLGTIIKDGDPSSVRPNSYVLRLGPAGEYLTTGKEFRLGEGANDKKGIVVPPGQSVALTAVETIDFRRETVARHFPDCDLHALISPTTDLQREGVVAPTTQVDAGYEGTLNWTLTNSSSEERRFVYRERLFRVTILKLADGERPASLYAGAYQGKKGYVRSERSGAPVGMRPQDWEESTTKEGPEVLLERLIQSGFPWNVLGTRLKTIDNQFQTVTNEYADIRDSMERLEGNLRESVERLESDLRQSVGRLEGDVRDIRKGLAQVPDKVREIVKDEQYRWLGGATTLAIGFGGLVLAAVKSPIVAQWLDQHGNWIGAGMAVAALLATWLLFWRR